jgi:signal transduction histidine kinase
MVQPRADANGLVLNVTYPTEGVALHVDGAKIVQILVNLLANAVKFTEPGGTVDLAAVLTDDGSFAFTVADTGIGMREEDQAVALAPFGQVNAASPAGRQGSGLGLSIVKALIELHSGTLKIESEPGVGSALTVTLPATRVETLA